MIHNPRTREAYELLHNGILALSRAEQQGIRVDLDYIQHKKPSIDKKIARLEEEFLDSNLYKHWSHTKAKINIHSNQQLSHFLYSVKKLKPIKTTESGQGATDEDALKALNLPELDLLLEIRKLKKVKKTYLEGFEKEQVNEYIHPFFNLHLVRTFRSSADSPNLQNIPKRDHEAMRIVRKALYPRPGHQLMEIDFSGMEVRVAACYHHDPNMIEYIENPKSDMHGDMAKQIFMLDELDKSTPGHYTLRQSAKNSFVFPEFYGDYYKNCAIGLCEWGKLPQTKWKAGQGIELESDVYLSDHLISNGIKSFDAFINHVKEIEKDFWGSRFRAYSEWKDWWWGQYQKYGYIDLATGFRCSGLMSRNDAINYPVQGSAFHCLLWSFIEVDKVMIKEKWGTRLIGQIHDSMLFDVLPEEREHVIQVAQKIVCEDLPKAWNWIIIPMSVDIDTYPVNKSWASKEC